MWVLALVVAVALLGDNAFEPLCVEPVPSPFGGVEPIERDWVVTTELSTATTNSLGAEAQLPAVADAAIVRRVYDLLMFIAIAGFAGWTVFNKLNAASCSGF